MTSLRDIQQHISTNLITLRDHYDIEDWSAFKDLSLQCQILTTKQIESYNRLIRLSRSQDMLMQLMYNIESSSDNLTKFKTLTQHAR